MIEKNDLLAIIESIKPTNIKAVAGLSRSEFISHLMDKKKSLYESEDIPINRSQYKDMMETQPDAEEGVSDIRRKYQDEVKDGKGGIRSTDPKQRLRERQKNNDGDKQIDDPKGKSEEPKEQPKPSEKPQPTEEKDEAQESVAKLKYATGLGTKVVEFDDTFKKLTEEERTQIADMFSNDELTAITSAKKIDWKPVKRRPLFVRADDIESNKSETQKLTVYSPESGSKQNDKMPSGFINTLYMRMDDGAEKAVIQPKTGRKFIPMAPNPDALGIAVLPLNRRSISRQRFAMLFKIPGREGMWIAPLSGERFMFYYKA